jgi:hypothetical protein
VLNYYTAGGQTKLAMEASRPSTPSKGRPQRTPIAAVASTADHLIDVFYAPPAFAQELSVGATRPLIPSRLIASEGFQPWLERLKSEFREGDNALPDEIYNTFWSGEHRLVAPHE